MSNIPENISAKIGAGLLEREGPLKFLKDELEVFFSLDRKFILYNSKNPRVSTKANFDDLLIPEDHVSRSEKDTYYQDENTVLRTHTSAHQSEMISDGYKRFLAFGDCYRRDSIDSTHYPVFHQVEGVRLEMYWGEESAIISLKCVLEKLMKHLLQDENMQFRWVDAYFPFTEPSFELEIFYRDEWLEVLGCGLVHKQILKNNKLEDYCGWAFGIGLERLAMIRFQIPDIRLFWTEDERFTSQFKDRLWFDDFVFESYSKHPNVELR